MTAIATPANPTAAPAEPPWNRLGQPMLGPTSAPIPAVILAGVSFGVLPAILWPWQWATLLDRDRPYYRDLANWWRRRVPRADGGELDRVLARLHPRPILMVLPWLAATFTLATAVVMLLVEPVSLHDLLPRLFECTYRVRPGTAQWHVALDRHVHTVWLWGLGFAYVCHAYAVRSHARAVGDLVRWTNRWSKGTEVRRVRNETKRTGLNAIWVVSAVGMCWLHAWWAIPMVVAGAAQRRYADVGAPQLQKSLAAQAGDAMTMATPDAAPDGARFCPTPNCGNRLPAPAAYCPRCGAATVTADANTDANSTEA